MLKSIHWIKRSANSREVFIIYNSLLHMVKIDMIIIASDLLDIHTCVSNWLSLIIDFTALENINLSGPAGILWLGLSIPTGLLILHRTFQLSPQLKLSSGMLSHTWSSFSQKFSLQFLTLSLT